MTPPVLFAHERAGIARAVQRVLSLNGLRLEAVRDGDAAEEALRARRYAALVVDVALPGIHGYELCGLAKDLAARSEDAGAPLVVLIASVYRRTSYKRRPSSLYGADDYVEIHHLGDMLPEKLARLIGVQNADEPSRSEAEDEAAEALRVEGDARMETFDAEDLAALIVADMILYNGDTILDASDIDSARESVAEDLEIARELMDQVARAEGRPPPGGDPIGRAFGELMRVMGRGGRG